LNFNADLLRRLLRMRCLERFRFGGEWLVAIDATEIRTYSKPHCKRCLRRKLSNGQYQYFPEGVLQAGAGSETTVPQVAHVSGTGLSIRL